MILRGEKVLTTESKAFRSLRTPGNEQYFASLSNAIPSSHPQEKVVPQILYHFHNLKELKNQCSRLSHYVTILSRSFGYCASTLVSPSVKSE